MDIDGDGITDLFSGSFSVSGADAGHFWILRGRPDGSFSPAESLQGTDGVPLVIHGREGSSPDRTTCTRPTALDVDGDGDLDIVTGNAEGTFHLFEGLGKGRFQPTSTPLLDRSGVEISVVHHSDPVFVDWDDDGDLDLVSGSTIGVHLFTNVGGGGAPVFADRRDLFRYAGSQEYFGPELRFGDAHITEPQGSIRLWIDDVNGDGRFDLVLGDHCYTVSRPGEGLTEAEARAKLAAWEQRMAELEARYAEEPTDELVAELTAHDAARSRIVQKGAGSVWVAYQESP
ncbi:FG-GAP repeat protein [Planctomycetes bacterium Pla163]|uniref:FG-GAP repeat protein n=1 Tax=Rohdeia mirabilis TaxID=2528008 RepID=A0A518D1A7_9BACT|nr:FG-GAP repeat protein [Planctomycetes bacterium Pla163]